MSRQPRIISQYIFNNLPKSFKKQPVRAAVLGGRLHLTNEDRQLKSHLRDGFLFGLFFSFILILIHV
ncbi:hypothetical protein K469DRAFT_268598 [Zopfia rhizophila CBS 207.26]|uniref:Uncharacterized protein n=1 Tax=Zopfia rhizophila CBS 207.26 TaxID=1314779 RepID=A0A6A6DSP8_9PEZI|nr:hypothetical protein K469DRAFT_268598 [Zopfia rhizophila CBS 207.26]